MACACMHVCVCLCVCVCVCAHVHVQEGQWVEEEGLQRRRVWKRSHVRTVHPHAADRVVA